MIIICSGPDTYRAREKARELVVAFRAKHDQRGLATESIDGTEGVSSLFSRLAGASLFSPKKLIRADGCLEKMKMTEARALAARLEQDKDQTIILTVEEEAPASKTIEVFKSAPLFHYPFPTQSGSAFRLWVRAQAESRGVSQKNADAIATFAEGDSWLAIQELEKQAAHSQEIQQNVIGVGSIFEVADAILAERGNWRQSVEVLEDENVVSIAVNQARGYIRVRDGFSEGLHPYVAKKLSSMKVANAEERFRKLKKALVSSRSGLASGSETETLL